MKILDPPLVFDYEIQKANQEIISYLHPFLYNEKQVCDMNLNIDYASNWYVRHSIKLWESNSFEEYEKEN